MTREWAGTVIATPSSVRGEGYISTYYGSSGDSNEGSPPKVGGAPVARYHDTLSMRSVYTQIWRGVQILSADPCPVVSQRAQNIIHIVLDKVVINGY